MSQYDLHAQELKDLIASGENLMMRYSDLYRVVRGIKPHAERAEWGFVSRSVRNSLTEAHGLFAEVFQETEVGDPIQSME